MEKTENGFRSGGVEEGIVTETASVEAKNIGHQVKIEIEVRVLEPSAYVLSIKLFLPPSLLPRPQPPLRCGQCRQFLDDPSLKQFMGDPENAVSVWTQLQPPTFTLPYPTPRLRSSLH